MCISAKNKKLFGVALDPVDDPWSLQLKQAWMNADHSRLDRLSAYLDPYDAVTGSMADILEEHHIEPAGKFPIPSWLWPKPELSDLPYVTAENISKFFDSGDLLEIIKQINFFVRQNILPDIPVMAGIDHSATAGVIMALSDKYGPENLGLVVLDQHFDAIPLSVRLEKITRTSPDSASRLPVGFSDQFCCGNFWAYLMDNGIIYPENIVFIGVGDYPGHTENSQGDSFSKNYLKFEKRGCGFFPLDSFEDDYHDTLAGFLGEKIKTPQIYVSLDLDVGSYAGTYAARYMDRPGLNEQNILDIADTITNKCRHGEFSIVGLDIMEFNMHFLGIETPDGIKDRTLDLVKEFIAILT